MKPYILFFLVLFAVGSLYPQSGAPGYYINQKDEKVTAEIKVSKAWYGGFKNNFLKEVEVSENHGAFKKYKPDEIKGYGFLYEYNMYVFRSKPVEDGSYKFLIPVVLGPKTSLYYYEIVKSIGRATVTERLYTFERSDGTFLFLKNNGTDEKSKTKLKDFYRDNPTVQQLVDIKIKRTTNQTLEDYEELIKEIVNAYNRS